MPAGKLNLMRTAALAAATLLCTVGQGAEPEKVTSSPYQPVPTFRPIGEYRVGYIKPPWFAHFIGYSLKNPYVHQITQPMRQVVYGSRHANYYVTYRSLYAPQWNVMYVPRNSPYCPPEFQQTDAPADPAAVAPYGPGSATYFGAYGY